MYEYSRRLFVKDYAWYLFIIIFAYNGSRRQHDATKVETGRA